MKIRNVASSCLTLPLLAIAISGCAFAQTGIIATVAGSWIAGFSGDNGPAINAELNSPNNVAVDAQGNIYFVDSAFATNFATPAGGYTPRIRKVNASTGIITTVAGNGIQGFSGDTGPATSAELNTVDGLAIDSSGNLFIVDSGNQRIRRVDAATGIITTVAGGGTANPGDGASALSAALIPTGGLAVDSSGNLYIGDSYVIGTYATDGPIENIYAYRIREVAAATGIITTIAGIPCTIANGTTGGCYSGDGGPAISAQFFSPVALAVDNAGNLFLADNGSGRIREINAKTGIITTVAGNGTFGFAGDGGPATSAEFGPPTGLALDASGNLYIADPRNERVRMVAAATGIITTVAGSTCPESSPYTLPSGCFGGDGGPATSALFNGPDSVAVDSSGNLYIADTGNSRIREAFFSANPVIAMLSQTSDPAGSAAFTLTVNGANFVPGSTLNWSGTPLSTTFLSSGQLSALVTANLLANGGNASLNVTNPASGGVSVSNVVAFTVVPFGPPVITLLTPSGINSGAISGFTMAVFGEGFVPGSPVFWNGTALTTTYVSSTVLFVTVPASLVTNPAVVQVTAGTPGVTAASNFLPFTISTGLAPPTLYLNPGVGTAGGPAFTLAATELGSSAPATIYWNGVPLNTTFANTSVNGVSVSGQLTATVPAALIANPGFAVVTLGPGGASAVFTIAAAGGSANLLSIPHIADGAGWTTTFAIQNIDTVPASFNFSFWADDGTALPLTVQNADGTPAILSGSLSPGHSYFLQSPGTSASLLEGWAQVGSSGQLGVMAIFNYTAPGIPASQGTVIGSTSASAISMPYDNTGGYIMGVALANANPTQALTVSLSFLTDQGAQSTGQVTVPAHGHTAFVLATQFPATANTRGTIHFTTTTPDLSVLGERFTPSLSFTTLGTFE